MELHLQNKSTSTVHNAVAAQTSLGAAPSDIYQLEAEIASIKSQSSQALQNEKENDNNVNENAQTEFDTAPYKLFDIKDITAAKQVLSTGQAIQLQLPSNVTPCALLGMTHYLGLDRTHLQKLFQNTSSTEAKRVLQQHVAALKQKYARVAHIDHPYAATACGGYLYHCTRIDALQCERDLSAKLRICMDLDFNACVENDDTFADKFRYELCTQVFKCRVDGVRVLDVRAGSVIVIVAGVTLITLAAAGLFMLSVKLYQTRNRAQQDVATGSSVNSVSHDHKSIDSAPMLKPSEPCLGVHLMSSSSPSHALPQIQNNEARTAPPSSSSAAAAPGFFANLFGKLRNGLSQLSANRDNDKNEAPLRHDLCDDDGSDSKSEFIADNDVCLESSSKFDSLGSSQLTVFSSIKSSLIPSISTMNGEMLQLNINDLVWVQRKNQLWSATVVGLTQTKATVEYENGGPYLFTKRETIALSDPCLMQNEPGMIPEIEGCVQISKSNGGYIKAWRSGLQRPMADM